MLKVNGKSVDLDFINGKRIALEHLKDSLEFHCELKDASHDYIYTDFMSCVDFDPSLGLAYLAYSNQVSSDSLSCVILFFDGFGEKIDGFVGPVNQVHNIMIPSGAVQYKLGLRFAASGRFCLYGFYLGSSEYIARVTGELNVFKFSMGEFLKWRNFTGDPLQLDKPLIILETLFCDTEMNDDILRRYHSFFEGLFVSVSCQSYRNFLWFIYVSRDKSYYIDEIQKRIDEFGVADRVLVIEYDHPNSGYGTECDSHIDKSRRPNATIPSRREELFDIGVKGARLDLSNFNDVLIRLAVDDDDFLSSQYFLNIVDCVVQYRNKLVSIDELIFGFKNISCAYYFGNGNVRVDSVTFAKIVTGAKFSCSVTKVPRSPYSLSEHIDDYKQSPSPVLGVEYVVVSDNTVGFSYNRHGQNFSNQNKRSHYIESKSVTIFPDHQSYLMYLVNGSMPE